MNTLLLDAIVSIVIYGTLFEMLKTRDGRIIISLFIIMSFLDISNSPVKNLF